MLLQIKTQIVVSVSDYILLSRFYRNKITENEWDKKTYQNIRKSTQNDCRLATYPTSVVFCFRLQHQKSLVFRLQFLELFPRHFWHCHITTDQSWVTLWRVSERCLTLLSLRFVSHFIDKSRNVINCNCTGKCHANQRTIKNNSNKRKQEQK